MLNDFFVTKIGMTQAWTKDGKRLAITRCAINPNIVVDARTTDVIDKESLIRQTKPVTILEIGYGRKKLKNMSKPLRSKLEKGGFSFGVTNLKGVRTGDETSTPKVGESINVDQVLVVGDVVQVQGVSKGRGFAGGVKRYGFKGGSRTHGQSDRERAVGSIGAGTTPGRVYKGKRMPGQYGNDTKTVSGLVVVYIDTESGELWLSGPVPGSMNSPIRIRKTGGARSIFLDAVASGIKVKSDLETEKVEKAEPAVTEVMEEAPAETETPAEAEMPTETETPAETAEK